MVSYESATETIRPPSEMEPPARPLGDPLPSTCSWCWTRPRPAHGPSQPTIGSSIRAPSTGMCLHQTPLVLVQRTRLVEDLRRDPELPDVVHQRGPPQAIPIGLGQLELLAEQVGVDPHPLGVPARAPVVRLQRDRERQDRPAVRASSRAADRLRLGQPRLQPPHAPCGPGDGEPGRRLVGEQHRELQQRHQGEEPPRCAFDPDRDEQRAGEDPERPAEPPGSVGRGHESSEHRRRAERDRRSGRAR